MTVARSHKGSAKPSTLAAGISNTATSFALASGGGTGYPDGSGGVFVVTIDAGVAAEEKILCSARSGDAFTVAASGRGYDDTVATAHVQNASVRHTFSAVEAQEANTHITATTGVHGIADTAQLLTVAAGNTAYAGIAAEAAWTGYTPSFVNFTLGNGTVVGRYKKVGKTVHVQVQVTVGSTSAFSGAVTISLPAAAVSASLEQELSAKYYAVAATSNWMGFAYIVAGGTVANLYSPVNATSPALQAFAGSAGAVVLPSGGIFVLYGTYECA